jgi:hypothetical protein
MMTAIGHLANHGYVTVLRSSSGEKQTILLTPDLLTNLTASFALEARRNPRGLGALDEADVLHGIYQFPELVSLVEEEQQTLLDAATVLFLEHNICFRETLGSRILLIFPALINEKRPIVEQLEIVDDVSYIISGAIENVYAAMVVLLGYTNTFTRTHQWQNQAQYEIATGEVCGFRQIEEREGEIELVLYYGNDTPEHARMLFQGLFETFLQRRDVKISKYSPVDCQKCGYRQERGEVVRRMRVGRDFLFCNECGNKIPMVKSEEVSTLSLSRQDRERLNQEQTLSRLRTSYESALVRVKGRMRGQANSPRCFINYSWGVTEHERWVFVLAKDLRNAGINVIFDRWDVHPGSSLSKFIEKIVTSDYVIVVGTPNLREKYDTEDADPVVDAELRLINTKLRQRTNKREGVLPLLLDGTLETSFPPMFGDSAYLDFRNPKDYFRALFDAILTLYGIRFDDPTVADLRAEILREE